MDLLLTSVRVAVLSCQPLGDCIEICAIINEFADSTESKSFWEAVGDGKCHLLRARLLRGKWTEYWLSYARCAMSEAALHGHYDVVVLMHDMIPITPSQAYPMLKKAAQSGNIQLTEWLYDISDARERDNRRFILNSMADFDHLDAVRSGSIEMIEWVENHIHDSSYLNKMSLERLLLEAASRGFLAVVSWLVDKKQAAITAQAFDRAAENDHLDILKWMSSHSTSRWTTRAMFKASRNGHLQVIQWLYEEGSKQCWERDMKAAAVNGHLDVVKWIFTSVNPAFQTFAIDQVAGSGHLGVIRWLHSNSNCYLVYSTDAMDSAAKNGHLEVVAWLHSNRNEGCTVAAMDMAAQHGHLHVVKWLNCNRQEGCTVAAMDMAATFGHLDVVKYLHSNRQEGCTVAGMDNAAKNGYLEVVKWLHENRFEGCSSAAIDGALNNHSKPGCWEVVQWLHANRSEACTSAVQTLVTDGFRESARYFLRRKNEYHAARTFANFEVSYRAQITSAQAKYQWLVNAGLLSPQPGLAALFESL